MRQVRRNALRRGTAGTQVVQGYVEKHTQSYDANGNMHAAAGDSAATATLAQAGGIPARASEVGPFFSFQSRLAIVHDI